jgi:hypothetical protein
MHIRDPPLWVGLDHIAVIRVVVGVHDEGCESPVVNMVPPKPSEIAVDENVAIEHQEALLQQLSRLAKRPGSTQRWVFDAVSGFNAKGATIAKMSFNPIGQMGNQEEDFCETVSRGQYNLMLEIGPVAD